MKRTAIVSALALATALSQNACATVGMLEKLPPHAGTSRTFESPSDTVAQAVRSAIPRDKLFLHSEKRLANGEYAFYAEKGMSFNDYGSLVRVVVIADSVRPRESVVRVTTVRRLSTNVTAEKDYSLSLFHQIEMGLHVFQPGVLPLLPGSRLRVHYPDGRVQPAVLRKSRIDTIAVAFAPTDTEATLPLTALKALEVELSPTERRARIQQGMMVGALLGGVLGFGVGYALAPSSGCNAAEEFCIGVNTRVVSGYLGSVAGSLLGMAVGRHTAIPRSGAFRPVPVPLRAGDQSR